MTFPTYDAIKGWFILRLWTADMVAKAVELKVITADQYKEITGEDYVAPTTK
ncbi:XkdX family protein [Lactiplantibacillus argentoratensis]|uniref:XkdX family protein n=1 Tax=Lactiplantibacillus argentoratensis TaxID=271881 RepID=UPI001B331A9A|nr:XkdX family protein [Lactiplantibacillus argentoratensis]MBP5807822.1 XkdX family protein [Lactiplantibacillus argentoratensis]